MKYQELIKEVEGVGKLELSEQEEFYRNVLNESSNDLEVMVAATFYLGMASSRSPPAFPSRSRYRRDLRLPVPCR